MTRDLEKTLAGLGEKVREHLSRREVAGEAGDAEAYIRHSDEARRFLSLIEVVLTGSTQTRRLIS